MKRSGNHFQIEHLVEAVLNRDSTNTATSPDLRNVAEEVYAFDCSKLRAVVFGGGTGLSTVVGGNSQLADWPNNPNVGLKQLFPRLEVVVCTTDDGRSTGEFLKQLPMIGIGDLRKLCLSMILPENLEKQYGIDSQQRRTLLRIIHRIFNHRFPEGSVNYRQMADPLLVVPESLRGACPRPLVQQLRLLGTFMTPGGDGPTVRPGGHCLGNILLTAAIFKETGGCFHRPPTMAALRTGIDHIARLISSQPGRLHPATTAPGQLVFRYANGVEVHGQSKSSMSRRGFPVEKVYAEFYAFPAVHAEIIRAVRGADLIILAPGSLYTSSIPVLQLPGIAGAIRANRSALKILAANFWVEEGETDITRTDRRRGFHVSELVDAYDRNVPGGSSGLFDYVLSANLEHIPGSILRNYALEGKRPIYLDRQCVEAAGVHPVEATIFSFDHLKTAGVIQHDPKKFTLAVRTLLFASRHGRPGRGKSAVTRASKDDLRGYHRSKQLLCDYWSAFNSSLARKDFCPAHLRNSMLDLVWENRDMRLDHLNFFAGARIVSDDKWNRSIEWDNVLGYYDPRDRYLKLHSQLLNDPERLRGNILIALGESLLGRYIEERNWITPAGADSWGSRCFEIRLLPPHKRECFLSPAQLHDYLLLARMVPHPGDLRTYRITLNHNDGFLPSGLLFGLMYAWYLDNSYGPIMEIEMSILHLQEDMLIPHQGKECRRKKALVDFFRKEVLDFPQKQATVRAFYKPGIPCRHYHANRHHDLETAMELKPRAYEKIVQLINKGVALYNPLTLDIGDEVAVDQISGNGVTIYPGCRIYGAKTVISSGVALGKEGPVTVDNCQLGPQVELKAGYFNQSVFLQKANMSSGAHVREGCILEEEANGAHCVGLKQTILFPFVTLGSLINFCDCLMAGGTSRKDHSEVGSSYIHFNFTPDGNKTTASLFGDVPRGVMLNQPAIFLGGQGGIVGPARLGYGTVVAAGSVVRSDVPGNKKLIIAGAHPGGAKDFIAHAYKNLSRIVGNNVIYLANLVALEQWYRHIRQPFFSRQEFGTLIFAGAIEKLTMAKTERLTRLRALAEKVPESNAAGQNLRENLDRVCALFEAELKDNAVSAARDRFLAGFQESTRGDSKDYIRAIQALLPAVAQEGTVWLQGIIHNLCSRAASMLTALDMFPPHSN